MLPNDDNLTNPNTHALPSRKEKVLEPLRASALVDDPDAENAIKLIRNKLDSIYGNEPDVKKEIEEDNAHHGRRSKHQQFMHELSTSGKSLAEIQTAWHEYYQGLTDPEKHKVWQEFYADYNKQPASKRTEPIHPAAPKVRQPKQPVAVHHEAPLTDPKAIKKHIRETAKARAAQKNHHFASIKFGLMSGVLVVFVLMFGFFNERVLTPFIRPNANASNIPLILDANEEVGPEPMLIIPKINVQTPVVYDEESIEEAAVQTALERGVLHYATTPEPGEFGNSVIFGHSSNNILNGGDYKYVFVQLNKMEIGDTFYIHKNGTRYVYKIFDKKIVRPDQVSVLQNDESDASMTLITCDPPGTAINRLVVVGEQISPTTDQNTQSSVATSPTEPAILPSNSPSLWSRITGWFSS